MVSAQTLTALTQDLSALPWTTAVSGYGPVEIDRANGTDAPGDGGPLIIEGVTYQKGLGVHSNSEIVYQLAGKCTGFTATVGLNDYKLGDALGASGSVVFQVYADGVKLYDSGLMRGDSPAKSVNVGLSGKQTLRLVTTDGGDGRTNDHADWAVPKLSCTLDQPAALNFQPASSAVPAGYAAETGAAYSPARGYGWIREDSVGSAGPAPLDITPNTRDRAISGVEAPLNTLAHMQYTLSGTSSVTTPAAWEYALPNGVYTVAVSAGDASNSYDSLHQLNIEGQLAVAGFTPTPARKFAYAARRVSVTDGRLTIDARGGKNTKINYVRIDTGSRPSIRVSHPQPAETLVATNVSVTADVNLPTSAIDLATLSADTVRLIDAGTNLPISATINTSGGGDAIVLKPRQELPANTSFVFEITSGLKDTRGAAFLPFRSTFRTGDSSVGVTDVAFEQIAQSAAPAKGYSSVEIGPDGKLYAATLQGEIVRFGILADGTLTSPQVISSVQTANGGARSIMGMKFDPASNADNLILWISNNYMYRGSTAPDWSGKITRLSGPNLEVVQDYVVGLPRSVRDHATNSISFKPGEPGALYVLQGSNTSMGAPDAGWGNRPEHLLNAALLRVDLSRITSPPLNVQTEDGGSYNPYAAGAPLTIYASGLRNAYDMVWHSNGQLYIPVNGGAAGGNTPGTPSPLPPSCAGRPDGPYSGPAVPALSGVSVQHDYLVRALPGGYYGHPNPQRCEWTLNGGNPGVGPDAAEVLEYPVGIAPDRNFRGFSYDFGEHASPNGVIEEYSNAPSSSLRRMLLVVRYSAGKDIIGLKIGSNYDIVSAKTNIKGLVNFSPSPLDLTEDRTNGHLYVAQLDEGSGTGKITLARQTSP